MADSQARELPDLTKGIPVSRFEKDPAIEGTVGDKEVAIVRTGGRFFAVGARCTHYKGHLADGLVVDKTIRCPLHHACFSLETGEALRAPALDPIACWKVEEKDGKVFVREKLEEQAAPPPALKQNPSSVVIVGGGAAGLAAADMLRREGYTNPVTIVSSDQDAPVDRPNLSKDYLAGEAQDDWIPMWPPELYEERHVELVLGTRVASIDSAARTISLENGTQRNYGALLLATGADPVHLPVAGNNKDQILYLRTFADSRAIVERTKGASRVVVVGASFIGLEVAASLRTRGINVEVVAPESMPLEKVMGAEIGRFVKGLHEAHGVVFHLGQTVASVDGRTVTLSGGDTIDADFVVMGVGVRPSTALAEKTGLRLDKGVIVNEHLETSSKGIFAAGDVARWPDPHSNQPIRVEHWVVAQRQGQVAARNILGHGEPFDAVPFFWSQHYDIAIKYVGHAERWDRVQIDGWLEKQDAMVSFFEKDRRVAVATVSRDRASLQAEVELEQQFTI
jgi:3-phenylpropionate/trans-cinnamate dioxygenase ferredoxin reductase subunit